MAVACEFSIDANDENEDFGPGRLINHCGVLGNLFPVFSEEYQRLYFIASRDIPSDTQLFYDYNDTDPEALQEPRNDFLKRPSKRSSVPKPKKKQLARRSMRTKNRNAESSGRNRGAGIVSESEESARASSINTVHLPYSPLIFYLDFVVYFSFTLCNVLSYISFFSLGFLVLLKFSDLVSSFRLYIYMYIFTNVQVDVFETTPVIDRSAESPAAASSTAMSTDAGSDEFSVIEFAQPDASDDDIPARVGVVSFTLDCVHTYHLIL